MIELTDEDRRESNSQNSKGNQLKFKKDNIWYKADGSGPEGLSETVVSRILNCSNCSKYVAYQEEKVLYNGTIYNACKSDNFIDDSCESIVTAYRLIENYYGKDIYDLIKFKTTKHKIEKFVDLTSKATKIEDIEIGRVLTQMLELDAYTLNNDRHFNNIAFIYNEKTDTYRMTPIYDNGAAFMSYKQCYQNSKYVEVIEARPFSREFEKQKEVAEELFKRQLQIELSDFNKIMPSESIYDPNTRINVMGIINAQTNRYKDIVKITDLKQVEKTFNALRHELQREKVGFTPESNESQNQLTQKSARAMFQEGESEDLNQKHT